MKRLLLIPARGGSKGIPRKNLVELGGRPLLAWTVGEALSSGQGRVVVSTDCGEIAAVAKECGAEVPFLRPSELAGDEVGSWEVAMQALAELEKEGAKFDVLVLLQPTSPLRRAEDIGAAVRLLEASGGPAVVGVCVASTHPWMARRILPGGELEGFCAVPEGVKRRQDFPVAYEVNGAMYAIWTEVLRRAGTFHPAGALAYEMPRSRSVDIDTLEDLELARWRLGER